MRRFCMATCWSCSTPLDVPEKDAPGKVRREATCERCQAWIHCCKNCHFWNESGRNCEEPAADWVHDRERANFCDFFAIATPEAKRASSDKPGQPVSGRDAFDRLFRK